MASTQVFVLSEETTRWLSDNQIDGTVDNNVRTIRRGVLRDSSDDTTWHEEVSIPVVLNSLEALRFMGMKKSAAIDVLQNFSSRINQQSLHAHPHTDQILIGIADLIDFATGRLEGRGDAVSRNDDWPGKLKELGIKRSLREAICDPTFDSIRFTKTAKQWAQETMIDTWEFMRGADKRIMNQRGRIQNDLRRRSGSQAGQPLQAPGHTAGGGAASTGASLPQIGIKDPEPKIEDGEVMLYKGLTRERLDLARHEDGTLNWRELYSKPPGDFSRSKQIYYFTKQKDIAWIYAEYAKVRQPVLDCGVLMFPAKRSLLADGYHVFGDAWGDLVMACRGRKNGDAEAAIREEYEEYDLLFGLCCGQSTEQVRDLHDKSEIEVLYNRKRTAKAVQWVVMKDAFMRKIWDNVRGRAMFQLTHPE